MARNLQPARSIPVLRIATLNIAHGRKDSVNQLFVRKNTFENNLDDIAAMLKKNRPHVVALQEADAASLWSGSFDHVTYLASAAEYPWQTHAPNASSWLYSYGTALLSEQPIIETIKHTFTPSPPTLDKGFVLAQIKWPYGDEKTSRMIDVISVHLDFSRQSVRKQQLNEILKILSTRKNPTIIMGDFNSEWLTKASVIKELAEKLGFEAYEPESEIYHTYKGKRFDWILITNDMEFINHQVLPDTLSDHSMIIADIRFKDTSGKLQLQM
ncbi:endonuclease/exonuclease/phosphatase family protein [Kaarinaea lacus]